MAQFEYALDEHAAIMTMDSGENRFNPDFLNGFIACLDEIENNTDARVLLVKSGNPKIWSNGLDLDWIMDKAGKGDFDTTKAFFYLLNTFFERILMSPLITVACINGHAFAGGAITACAYDFRFMRTDRGFFCFPEVDLGIPFLPGMLALLRKAMTTDLYHNMILTGRRLPAAEGLEAGLFTGADDNDNLLATTLAWAKQLNKRREVVAAIKKGMYREIVRILHEEDKPIIESGRLYV